MHRVKNQCMAVLHCGPEQTRIQTEPLARPFARSLEPLTCLLASDCLPHSRPPLHSLVRLLAHFAQSLARGTVNDWMIFFLFFFSYIGHIIWVSVLGCNVCHGSIFCVFFLLTEIWTYKQMDTWTDATDRLFHKNTRLHLIRLENKYEML